MHGPLHMQEDHKRRWSRNTRIAALYSRGEPVDAIAMRYGVSRTQVLRIARIFSLPKRPKSKVSDADFKAAMTDYASGVPVADIADTYGVSQAWVSKHAQAAGIGRYQMGI